MHDKEWHYDEDNTAPFAVAPEKKSAKRRGLWCGILIVSFIGIVIISMIALVIAAFLGIVIYNGITTNGWVGKATVAATVGDEKIDSVEMNYYYIDAINNVYSQYGDYAETMFQMMGLDTSKPLDDQVYDEESGMTWADYFLDIAIQNAKSDYILAAEAKAQGFTLSDEDQDALNNIKPNLDLYATISGLPNGTAYLCSLYGKGASISSYLEYAKRSMLAENFYEEYKNNISFDYNAIANRDCESPQDFNNYDFIYYYIDYTKYFDISDDSYYTDDQIDKAIAWAKKTADMLATCENAESFKDTVANLAYQGIANQSISYSYYTAYDKINIAYRDWITDNSRIRGDIKVFENNSITTDAYGNEVKELKGYYVVCYEGMTDNKHTMSAVRHLLVKFTDDTEVTTESKNAAMKKAENLLKQWQEGEATEDSFKELVSIYTDDESSAQTGGLYEYIHKKSPYVENFLNWAIAKDRTAGDVEIIETEYGYHIMYFVKHHDMDYRTYIISEELKTEATEIWYNTLMNTVTSTIVNTKYLPTDFVLAPE